MVDKRSLYHASLLALGDGLRVGFGSHHQRQRTQQDTLAGTRLTRQYGETLAQLQLHMSYQRVVRYTQMP